MNTSDRSIRRRSAAIPAGDFRSTEKPSLLRLYSLKWELWLISGEVVAPPIVRTGSGKVGPSTLITSAPISARKRVPYGPAHTCVMSTTRRPASGSVAAAGGVAIRGGSLCSFSTWAVCSPSSGRRPRLAAVTPIELDRAGRQRVSAGHRAPHLAPEADLDEARPLEEVARARDHREGPAVAG